MALLIIFITILFYFINCVSSLTKFNVVSSGGGIRACYGSSLAMWYFAGNSDNYIEWWSTSGSTWAMRIYQCTEGSSPNVVSVLNYKLSESSQIGPNGSLPFPSFTPWNTTWTNMVEPLFHGRWTCGPKQTYNLNMLGVYVFGVITKSHEESSSEFQKELNKTIEETNQEDSGPETLINEPVEEITPGEISGYYLWGFNKPQDTLLLVFNNSLDSSRSMNFTKDYDPTDKSFIGYTDIIQGTSTATSAWTVSYYVYNQVGGPFDRPQIGDVYTTDAGMIYNLPIDQMCLRHGYKPNGNSPYRMLALDYTYDPIDPWHDIFNPVGFTITIIENSTAIGCWYTKAQVNLPNLYTCHFLYIPFVNVSGFPLAQLLPTLVGSRLKTRPRPMYETDLPIYEWYDDMFSNCVPLINQWFQATSPGNTLRLNIWLFMLILSYIILLVN